MVEIKELDNFLKESDFQEIINLKLKEVGNKEIKVYYNKIFKNGIIQTDCINNQSLKRINDYCHPVAMQLLEKFAPKKVNLYEYSEFHIVIAGKDFSFPMHRDSPNKLLSGVVYLYPQSNKGTTLYGSDKKQNLEIEWKQNKAFFFSRTENDSFHSYSSDGKSNRVVLVYNLMTTDIKGVCKVENTNYLYVKFREKINPYIYKYFKFFI